MRTEKRNDMHVTVGQERCTGSGMCVLAVGEVFDPSRAITVQQDVEA